MSNAFTSPGSEFALLPETAATIGVDPHTTPDVHRTWFTASVGGLVSAVIWGWGIPASVLVPDDGADARSLDRLALRLGLPVVVLDRPGTGRSSGPTTSAARSGPVVAEAVWSVAPLTSVLVGLGEGGAIAALAAAAHAKAITTVVVIDAGSAAEYSALMDVLAEKSIGVVHLGSVDIADLPSVAIALRDHLVRRAA
jgi:pimeloyl-ACP methyl ester carboxylesterase